MTDNDIIKDPDAKTDGENQSEESTNLGGDISGENVQLNQSSAGQVNGDRVELNQSAALNIGAENVILEGSAVLYSEAGSADFGSNNWVVVSNSTETVLNDSQVGTVLTNSAHLNQSAAGILVSRDVQAGSIRTGILLASNVEGTVETLLDTPKVVLAGLVSGVAAGLVIWLGNLLRSRRGR